MQYGKVAITRRLILGSLAASVCCYILAAMVAMYINESVGFQRRDIPAMLAVVATIIVGALMAGAGIFAAIMSNREDAKSASKH